MAKEYKPIPQLSAFFPPPPTFLPKDLPSLQGRVHIITGAASGIGYELAKILYLKGGVVYIAARSAARCQGAIEKLLEETEDGGREKGRLESMVVDLGDLRTIRAGVENFSRREERLDVLVHNAGVMEPPKGSRDVLGHDLELGTNCLGPYLLTHLLSPLLIRTAQLPSTPKNNTRIVWVVSLLQGWKPPHGQGITYEEDGTPKVLKGVMGNYMQSKVGAVWLSLEFARRLGGHGVTSVSIHPGVVKTELQRHWSLPVRALIATIMKPAVFAAYAELYAAYSPDVKENGAHLMAWGRPADMPPYIADGFKSNAEGGTGTAEKFFQYADAEIKDYL